MGQEDRPAGSRPPSVLFVDDEPLVIRSLRRTLSARAIVWEPRFAESGDDALRTVEREDIDVIVSDMHMPGMDGATLLRRVQEFHPEVVRIVLSGQTDPKLVFRAVPVAHQFLTKPFETSGLIRTIERALELRKLIVSPALRAVIGADNRLPAAPKTYTALTRILAREDASLPQIVALIERDAGLAARVAQLGASAFFRVPRTVTGIAGFVSYLGVEIIKTLVLNVEIVSMFGRDRAPPAGFSIDAFERHSVAVAHIARRIVERGEQAEDAFLAGILHDVGRLVLAARCPEKLADAINRSRRTGCSQHSAELEVMGVSHAEVAGYLLGIWGLPLEIVDAVLGHHGPTRPEWRSVGVARAVYVANVLAHDPDAAVDPGAEGLDGGAAERSAGAAQLERFREIAREVARGDAL